MTRGFELDVVKIQTSDNYRLLFRARKMENGGQGQKDLILEMWSDI